MISFITQPLRRTFLHFLIVGGTALMSSAKEPAQPIDVKNAILKPMKSVSVAAGVSGVLQEVFAKEGDIVKPNQGLAKIHCESAQLDYEKAKVSFDIAVVKASRDVDIRLAEKSAQVAEQELQRALKANALATDTYPANEVDRYRLVVDRAGIEIERCKLDQKLAELGMSQAEIELRQTQQMVERHTIRSASESMVVSVEKNSGEWVDQNSKIMELISIAQLRVEGFVNTHDAAELTKGQAATIWLDDAKEKRMIPGTVVFVSPISSPVNGQVRLFIEVDNSESALRPGMNVKVEIPR